MSEFCQDSLCCRPEDLTHALSIHTRKITDSCRDKDCIEDLRVYMTRESQNTLDGCAGVKIRCAELLYTAVDESPVAFIRNHYCVDLTFYYRMLADAQISACRPACLCGLALFSKRVMLCGETTQVHLYTSEDRDPCHTGLPTAVVEVLDPMVLSSKLVSIHAHEPCTLQIPTLVQKCFDDELVLGGDRQRLFVTLGQFSIIRLERPVQIIVPVLDYAIPTKECRDDVDCCAEDPCEVFSRIPFPADSFVTGGCSEGCDRCGNN